MLGKFSHLRKDNKKMHSLATLYLLIQKGANPSWVTDSFHWKLGQENLPVHVCYSYQYYKLHLLSVFSLAKSLQLISEIAQPKISLL